ncbi:unnamed protein product [Chrysoparadoxa australica]
MPTGFDEADSKREKEEENDLQEVDQANDVGDIADGYLDESDDEEDWQGQDLRTPSSYCRASCHTVVAPKTESIRLSLQEIIGILRTHSKAAASSVGMYSQFAYLFYETSPSSNAQAFLCSQDCFEVFSKSIASYRKSASLILSGRIPTLIPRRLILIDCEDVSVDIFQRAEKLTNGIMSAVFCKIQSEINALVRSARSIMQRLNTRPKTIDALVEATQYLSTLKSGDMVRLTEDQASATKMVHFYFAHGSLTNDALEEITGMHRIMRDLSEAMTKASEVIEQEKVSLLREIDKTRKGILDGLETLRPSVEQLLQMGGRQRDMMERVQQVQTELDLYKAQVKEVAREEGKLSASGKGKEVAMVQKLEEEFTPFAELWTTAAAVTRATSVWARGPVTLLNGPTIEKEYAEMKAKLESVLVVLRADKREGAVKGGEEALRQLNSIAKDMPIIRALSSPALKSKHWQEISDIAGFSISAEHPTTLQQLNELGVFSTDTKVKQVLAVAEVANLEEQAYASLGPVEEFLANTKVRMTARVNVHVNSHGKQDEVTERALDADGTSEALGKIPGHLAVVEEARGSETVAKLALASHAVLPHLDKLTESLQSSQKHGELLLCVSSLVEEVRETLSAEDLEEDEEARVRMLLVMWKELLVDIAGRELFELGDVQDRLTVLERRLAAESDSETDDDDDSDDEEDEDDEGDEGKDDDSEDEDDEGKDGEDGDDENDEDGDE